jgi:hypothetical protein
VHNHSLVNLLRGIRERVFAVEKDGELRPPPKPLAGVFNLRLAGFFALLCVHLVYVNPWSYDQFVDSYDGLRKVRYAAAVASLRMLALCARDAWVKGFVKAEKLNLSNKSDPAPRMISPRSPRFNVVLGCFIRPAEAVICRAIAAVFGGPTVMKGYNAVKIAGHLFAMWCSFTSPIAVGLDASRFDQHVSVQALQWEHSVYLWMFRQGPNSKLAGLLRSQLRNHVKCYAPEGSVAYTVEGTRMSGDMNTSLGNCLLMCAMVYAYAAYVGVRVRLANNGDDCVVFMESRDELRFTAGLNAWFLEMGFTMKVEDTVRVFEHVEFCQTRPVCVDGEYVMCRSPHVGLAKDSVCLQPCNDEHFLTSYEQWAREVGTAGCALASGMPVLQSVYLRMSQMGRQRKKAWIQGLTGHSGLRIGAKGMATRVRPPSPSTRYSFWLAWGITPDEQTALESAAAQFQQPTFVSEEVSYQLAIGLPIPS